MRCILLSNVPHYHYLASALHKAGILARYVTAISVLRSQRWHRLLSSHWQKKLEARRLTGVPDALVRRLWLPEVLQRALPAARLMSRERADWLNNHLFDRLAMRWVTDCDVFHFVSSVGLYSARKAKKLGARIVCDVRQEHPRFQRRILEEEARRFGLRPEFPCTSYESKVLEEFSLADFLVVPSAHAKTTYIAEGFSPERVIVLPYGVHLEHFRPGGNVNRKFRVLYAGSVTLRKGVQYLLEAFSRLRLPESELLLVGPLDPAMKPILAKYEGQFRYLPAVPKIELRHLYVESSVFVLPSLADSFSLATLEAMACGLPVIVSENTGAADLVANGHEGFVVPIRDVEAIVERLGFLYAHRETRMEMGRRATERAGRMTWQHYGSRAAMIYRRFARGQVLRSLQAVPA